MTTADAAVVRARLGVALRRHPSELNDFLSGADASEVDAGNPAEGSIAEIARDMEQVAPGLALMLQLRARVFDAALREARWRGIRQVIAIGCGLDDDRLVTSASRGMRVLDVDHGAVLALKPNVRTHVVRVPVERFDETLWAALERADALRRPRTFFLIQNASFWSSDHTLDLLLARFRDGVGLGSEMLIAVIAMADARRAGHAASEIPAASRPNAGIDVGIAVDRVQQLRLAVRGVFDSGDLQRSYLGFDDLLVRESYLWIANSRAGSRVACGAIAVKALTSGADAKRSSASDGRQADHPSLVGREVVRWTPSGGSDAVIARPVTALRTVNLSVGASRHSADLRALATRVIAALKDGDGAAARRASTGLAHVRGNAAIDHLRALLSGMGRATDARVFGEEPMHVLVRHAGDRGFAQDVLADAVELSARVASVLDVTPEIPVLIDVTAERSGIPLTYVEVADPHTVVRIPRPTYSRQVLCHELTHVFATASSLWLSEGLAVWMQRRVAPGSCFPDDQPEDVASTERAIRPGLLAGHLSCTQRGASRRVPSAAHRGSHPRWQARSTLQQRRTVYRQAARFVDFFVRRFGLASFLALFRACVVGSMDDLARACRTDGCESLAHIERLWCDEERARSA